MVRSCSDLSSDLSSALDSHSTSLLVFSPSPSSSNLSDLLPEADTENQIPSDWPPRKSLQSSVLYLALVHSFGFCSLKLHNILRRSVCDFTPSCEPVSLSESDLWIRFKPHAEIVRKNKIKCSFLKWNQHVFSFIAMNFTKKVLEIWTDIWPLLLSASFHERLETGSASIVFTWDNQPKTLKTEFSFVCKQPNKVTFTNEICCLLRFYLSNQICNF